MKMRMRMGMIMVMEMVMEMELIKPLQRKRHSPSTARKM
jgi:hypothetical protein